MSDNGMYSSLKKNLSDADSLLNDLEGFIGNAVSYGRQLENEYERVKGENAALRRENSRKAIEHSQFCALIERMKEAFGVLYQVLGQVGAPERILDLANNAANGEVPLEVGDALPVRPEEFDSALRVYAAPSHIRQVHVEQPGVWTFVPDAPSIETGEPL